jgi:hypothetical protein
MTSGKIAAREIFIKPSSGYLINEGLFRAKTIELTFPRNHSNNVIIENNNKTVGFSENKKQLLTPTKNLKENDEEY